MSTNKVYLGLCVSLSGLYFVVTGIQYWLPDYLKFCMDLPPNTAALYFSFTCFTAPIAGVVIGGLITTAMGGYNNPTAQMFQCYMGLCSVICALPIPFIDQFEYFGIFMWLVLFFGGMILPPVTGIMLNSVPEN